MTSNEFKRARQLLGLTQRQLAEVLGTSDVTIRKWEMRDDKSSSRKPNPVASTAMQWMLDGYRPSNFPIQNPDGNGNYQ